MELKFNTLVGKTLTKIDGKVGDDKITFETTEEKTYKLLHHNDCCESVLVEDICGDMDDLIGSPLLEAEESVSNKNPPEVTIIECQESFTWTFYRLSTLKGSVVIRWYGSSNGFYSENVDFEEVAE